MYKLSDGFMNSCCNPVQSYSNTVHYIYIMFLLALCAYMCLVCTCLRGRTGGAVAGWCRSVEPHQRGERGCRQCGAAVHSDQDSGRGGPASTGFLHAVPAQEEQTGTAWRPRRLQLPHRPGQDYFNSWMNPFCFNEACSVTMTVTADILVEEERQNDLQIEKWVRCMKKQKRERKWSR